jgi:WD40 repeat protein
MPVDGEPGSAVLNQHARVVRKLITSAPEGEPPSPYVVLRLAEHVAAAGAWDDLAAVPYLLDQLDPDSVAVAVLRTAFGRSDLPAPIGASLSARHLFNRLDPEDRLMTRWIAVACGSWARASDTHAWARIGEREPPHVVMFGHQGPVRAIAAWSQPDGGTLLVTSGDDGVVRVWDPMTGRPASAPLARGGPSLLSLVAMTVNGRSLLGAGGPRGIRLWNLEDGAGIDPETVDSNRPVRVLAALPQPGGEVVLACADPGGAVRLWRVHPDRLTPEVWSEPQHRTQTLAAFPRADGRTWLVTVGYDGYLRFWDPVTMREMASYPTGRGAGHLTNAVTVDDGAAMLAVSEDNGSIELLEFDAHGLLGSYEVLRVPGGEAVLTTALIRRSADSVLVAAACGDGTVHLFGRTSGQAFASSVLAGHSGRVLAAVFVGLGDGRTLLATGGDDGTVRLWHVDPRGLLPARADEPSRVQAIATVPTEVGDLLIVGGDDGTVQLHEAASGVPVGNGFTGHRGAIHAVAAARLPDGRRVLVTGGAERAVRVWDIATGSRLAGPLRGHQATIHAVAVLRSSPGNWLVASAGSDSAIRLWDPASGRPVGSPLRGHRGPIRCLAVAPSPAGSDTLISGGDDGTLRLWRLNGSGAAEFLRVDLPGSVTAAAVVTGTSAVQVVAVGGSEGVVWLLDAATWQPARTLQDGTPAEITALAAVPAETTLLAAGYRDGAIRIWHPESGRPLRTVLLPFGQRPRGLAATRSHLAVCTERGFLGFELDPRLSEELSASAYRSGPAPETTLPA